MKVNIHEAKAKLSALVEKAQAGEEVIIARAGRPVARIVPIAPHAGTKSGVRFGLVKKANLGLAEDFHEPMTDEDILGS